MIREKDGGVLLEWGETLFHGTSVKYLLAILKTSQLYFTRVRDWPDSGEIQIRSSNGAGQVAGISSRKEISFEYPSLYGHCWTITDHLDLVLSANNLFVPREVAIKTDFRSLYNSIKTEKVFGGTVSYRHYQNFRHPDLSDFSVYGSSFLKDRFFAPEREFRLLLSGQEEESDPASIGVPVDPAILIHEVFVGKKVSKAKVKKMEEALGNLGIHNCITRRES